MTYDVAVIGGGPAGMIAAIRAARGNARVILFEKNASLGRKLGLTGRGRCNLTNAADTEALLAAFGKNGLFLRDALRAFSAEDLAHFFAEQGVRFKTERQGRVFPESDSSQSVVEALRRGLAQQGVEVLTSVPVTGLAASSDGAWKISSSSGASCLARKVIISTGGSSYPETGSTGDGFRFALDLGHAISPIGPGLVPLETDQEPIKELQGLTLKNVKVVFQSDKRKIESPVGELLLTHFGISGPLVLDLSAQVYLLLRQGPVQCLVDLKPGLSPEKLEEKLVQEFGSPSPKMIKNYMTELLPQRLVPVFLSSARVNGDKKCHQVTAVERRRLVALLKAWPLVVRRARPLREAMVTQGGVSLKEVDPRTMGSRRAPGIYFCGEVLDLAAVSGGYNLQAAFSTGFVAGGAAASALRDARR